MQVDDSQHGVVFFYMIKLHEIDEFYIFFIDHALMFRMNSRIKAQGVHLKLRLRIHVSAF